ncbi:MAG: hypothetical protein K8I30_20810 [Anaerolineae bacterium]|nr:hypothetical protein [Anaerolineae bacterium]
MPIMVSQLPNEPIIVADCSGFLTREDFIGMFTQVNEMVQTMDGLIFRIADYRQAESSFMDILKTVQEATKGMPGSTADPRIQTIWVGTSQWIALARNFFQQQQFGHLQIPTFHNMEDAFAYARLEITRQTQTHKTATE